MKPEALCRLMLVDGTGELASMGEVPRESLGEERLNEDVLIV